jgi:hypothetical protein
MSMQDGVEPGSEVLSGTVVPVARSVEQELAEQLMAQAMTSRIAGQPGVGRKLQTRST